MRDFRKLRVWDEANDFVVKVYATTLRFPPDERFGLTSQLRRAAVAIPSNITEGAGRRSRADYGRFIDISLGSLNECEAQIMISRRLGFIEQHVERDAIASANSLRRQLISLRDRITAEA